MTERQVTEAEVRRIARCVAEETIKSLFTKLGIDYSSTRESQRDFAALRDLRQTFTSPEFIDDLKHLRRWRLLVNSVLSRMVLVLVGIIVVGLSAFLWAGFQDSVRGETATSVQQSVPPEAR